MEPIAWLPEVVDGGLLVRIGRRFIGGLDGVLSRSELKLETSGSRYGLRSLHSQRAPFIEMTKVIREDHEPAPDAQSVLTVGTADENIGGRMIGYIHQLGDGIDLDYWSRHQVSLWEASDEIEWLTTFCRNAELHAYRLRTSPALYARQRLLNVIDEVIDGVEPEDIPLGEARDIRLRDGNLEANPAFISCLPLVCRYQPFSMALSTRFGAQIVFLGNEGAFVRRELWVGWPTGAGLTSMLGPGDDAYAMGIDSIPHTAAYELLSACVQGADRLIEYLTAPSNWTDESDRYDPEERQVAWLSTILGFDTVREVAEVWTDEPWTAFRALDMMAGVWEGGRPHTRFLPMLLDPDYIRRFATPKTVGGYHSTWAHGLADILERELERAFPDNPREERPRLLQEIRNLFHGVRPMSRQDQRRRLNVLAAIDRVDGPRLHVVHDIAGLWWSTLLLRDSLDAYLRPGVAPWEAAGADDDVAGSE